MAGCFLVLSFGMLRDGKASQIFQAMQETYASCRTYSDTGSMKSEGDNITFITRFHRPTKFYFEFNELTDEKSRYVLWCPGSAQPGSGAYLETHTWDTRDRSKDSTPLGRAFAGFTGISRGTACNIPGMILPGEIGMGNIPRITDISFERSESIRGELCDVIASKDEDVKLWVSKRTHLIWHIVEGQGKAAEVSDYSPTVNQEIPDSLFAFTPPKK
jgi:outer membrane lipoprotein-sorting protein